MTVDKLVETVARAICKSLRGKDYDWDFYRHEATAAIAAVRQHTRDDGK